MFSQVISFVTPLLYLLGFTASLVYLTKRSFGKCLPLSMMLSAFLLFFSQLIFGTFNVGFAIGILFAVASIGIGIWQWKNWAEFKKLYFTSGFVIFLTVYVLVFIYDLARGYSAWDEFSHWGMMLKEMFRLDRFYSVEASNLMVHKDYPPIMQLFELFWTKLCGNYSEVFALRALHTFELSLFIPFIAEKVAEKKNVWKSILVGTAAMFALAFVVILFDQHGVFQSIYTDYVLALVTVYLLVTLFATKKVDWFTIITLSVGGGFLLLLKQMGLPLYLMAICYFVILLALREKGKFKKYLANVGWRKIVGATVLLMLPLVWWFIWGRQVADVSQQFSLSSLSVSEFVKVLLGRGEDWQSYTTKKYLMALGQDGISNSFLPISYIQGIIMFATVMYVIWRVFKKDLEKSEVIVLAAIVIVGAVGYAVAMLMLYTLSFGSYEGPILASYERYMGTYLIIMFATALMVAIWQAAKKQNRGIIYAIAVGLAILVAPTAYSRIYPDIKGFSQGNFAKYGIIADEMKEKAGEDAKIFMIAQDWVGFHYYMEYFATPMRINNLFYDWPTGAEWDAAEYYGSYVLPVLREYDYLYIARVDEEFNKKYCEDKKVLAICPVETGKLYQVTNLENGNVELEIVR